MPKDDGFALLELEMTMGMRAQSMGRDQNELIERMRELPPDLLFAYLSTDFVLDIFDQQAVLNIAGAVPSALIALDKSWAIMTAYNPYSTRTTDAENRALQSSLIELLGHHGFQIMPAIGRSRDGSWEEPSLLVLGISHNLAKAFGSCFMQTAIIYGEAGGPIELVFCDK